MTVVKVPKVFVSLEDKTITGQRPIYFSADGNKGKVIGLVTFLTPDGYEVLSEVLDAYNEAKNKEQ